MITQTSMNTWKWLVRREVWEHRGSLVRLPMILVVGVLSVLALTLVLAHPDVHPWPIAMGQYAGRAAFGAILGTWALLGVAMSLAMISYSAHCLYDERRDQSALFWKSLPLSDTATVLAKASVPLVVAPAIVWVLGVVGGTLLSGLGWLGLTHWGAPLSWSQAADSLRQLKLEGLGVTLLLSWPVFALSALPTVGWLMACSAWARSKPLLLAVVAPVMVWVVWNGVEMAGVPLPGFGQVAARVWTGWWSLPGQGPLSDRLIERLAQPDLWWGAVLGVGLLGVAVLGRQRVRI